jgi:hypothetical protein
VIRLVSKLLQADKDTLSLLDGDPFDGRAPAFVRVELYQYRFTAPGQPGWWQRQKVGTLIRPLSLRDPALIDALGL